MDYQRWSLAINTVTMFMTVLGLLAAVTYYFSLTDLEVKYYVFTYIAILALILFVFFTIFFEPAGGYKK
jgi:hypothetical protein